MENEVKKTVKAKKTVGEKKTLIYLGPSVGNVLATNSVFSEGIPESVKDLFEKCSAIEKLFCEPSKINEYKNAINDIGSLINLNYRKVLLYLKES